MKLLNLACNGCRLPEPFINIDILRTQLKLGTPERTNLDAELNYVEADLLKGIPFPDNSCDGILISHFIEHLDIKESVELLKDAYRVLVPNGYIFVSVPDTSYFRKVYNDDNKENAISLFGETINHWDVDGKIVGPFEKFFDYALFHHEHKQVLTEDSLWALMVKSGFDPQVVNDETEGDCYNLLKSGLNRHKFSLILWAVKK